jgi:hypothetical protein
MWPMRSRRRATPATAAPACRKPIIYAGGDRIGQVLANRYREDLKVAGLGSGRHRFTFTRPAGLVFAPHAVQVRRSLDGALLGQNNGTPSAAGTAPRVKVHRRAARR